MICVSYTVKHCLDVKHYLNDSCVAHYSQRENRYMGGFNFQQMLDRPTLFVTLTLNEMAGKWQL